MTVVQIPLSRPDVEGSEGQLFSSPGTISPADLSRAAPLYRLVLPLVATAAVTFGTVAVVTPADAAAYNVRATEQGTRGGLFDIDVSAPVQEDVASGLRRLRSTSGLTWGEVASALGVSRRAVHHWASGARISARHAERLGALTELVASYQGSGPSVTRACLVAPTEHGRSVLDLFGRDSQPDRKVPLSTQSLSDILAADSSEPNPPVAGASRPSSLRRRRLGDREHPD